MDKILRRAARALVFLCVSTTAGSAAADIPCDGLWRWIEYQCSGLKDAWHNGDADLYLTGWTHHNRNTYTPEKIAEFNEKAWGGGLGTSRYNDRGDAFGWYALAFKDSHYNYTKMMGWHWRTYWPAQGNLAAGLGYTAFIASRPDIFGGFPFPGILPLAAVKLSRVEVLGTYIPKVSQGTTGNGNVGFAFLRIHF